MYVFIGLDTILINVLIKLSRPILFCWPSRPSCWTNPFLSWPSRPSSWAPSWSTLSCWPSQPSFWAYPPPSCRPFQPSCWTNPSLSRRPCQLSYWTSSGHPGRPYGRTRPSPCHPGGPYGRHPSRPVLVLFVDPAIPVRGARSGRGATTPIVSVS